jgi:hypothetical protein
MRAIKRRKLSREKGGKRTMKRTDTACRVAVLLVALVLVLGILACEFGKGAAPTAEITFPPTGRQVQVGGTVPIHSVSRDDRGLSRIELWSGGQVIDTTTATGTTYVGVQYWTASEVGVFNLGVRAVDSDGQSSEAAIISIQVVASSSEITDPLPQAPEAPVETPSGEVQPTTSSGEPSSQPEEPTTEAEVPTAEPGEPVDLELSNLTLSNVNPAPGEEIVVGVTIVNRGGTAAEDFHWGWDPGTGEEPVQSEAIGLLAPGDDVVQEIGYTYQQAGQYSAYAWADSMDAYDEPDETNNFEYEDVNVSAAVQDQAAATVSFHDYQDGGWATFRVDNTGTVALECVNVVVNCGEGAFALHTEVQQPRPFLGGYSGRPPGDESLAAGQGSAMAVQIGEMTGDVQCQGEFTFYSQNGGQGLSTGPISLEFSVQGAEAEQIGATVSYHNYQDDAWVTFGVENTGNVPLESMSVLIRRRSGEQLANVRGNQPFLGGWSGRPPGDARLQPGEGAAMAIEIGPQPLGIWCIAEFTFFSEDNGGGLSTGIVYVEFEVE